MGNKVKNTWKSWCKYMKDSPVIGWGMVFLLAFTVLVALILFALWVGRKIAAAKKAKAAGTSSASRNIDIRMSPSPVHEAHVKGGKSAEIKTPSHV